MSIKTIRSRRCGVLTGHKKTVGAENKVVPLQGTNRQEVNRNPGLRYRSTLGLNVLPFQGIAFTTIHALKVCDVDLFPLPHTVIRDPLSGPGEDSTEILL